MKGFLSEFLHWNRSDRRVYLALLSVTVIILTILIFSEGDSDQTVPLAVINTNAQSTDTPYAPTAQHRYPQTTQHPYAQTPNLPKAELFPFDPNSADSTQLLRLGLSERIVHNIYKYRAAGGIFRKPEDFARLYGLTVGQYRELEPYIRISPDYLPASTLFPSRSSASSFSDSSAPSGSATSPSSSPSVSDSSASSVAVGGSPAGPLQKYPAKIAPGETLELSIADTTSLRTIPGIGPYYARRIVDYGRRLGGYVSLDQLDEIEGFPSEAKDYLTLSPSSHVKRLNVNTLSLDDLKRHPYINFRMARAIVDYRRQQGTISSLDDLRLLPDFTDEVISRLKPYVEY